MSSSAIGGASKIRTASVPVSVPPLPSSMVYGICTVPMKPGFGVKMATPVTGSTVTKPAGLPSGSFTGITVPPDGSIPFTSVTVITSPGFGSLSLLSIFVVAFSPAAASARSSTATGSSLSGPLLSGSIVKVTVASSLAPNGSTIV